MADEILKDGSGAGDVGAGEPSGGGAAGKWFDSLADDLKGNSLINGYESVEDMAKAHVELSGKVPVVPTEAAAYGIEMEGLADKCLEMGLTAEQGKGIEAMMTEATAQFDEQVKTQLAAMETESVNYLNKAFGENAAATRNTMLEGLKRIIPQEHAEAFGKFVANPYVGSNPAFIVMAETIMRRVAPDSFVSSEGGGVGGKGLASFYDKSDMK